MDRQAMDYREPAATSPLNGSETRPYRDRPVLQHLRADDQVAPGQPVAGNFHRTAAPRSSDNVQTVSLQSILKGAREAIIDFDGAAYRLRITRNHRLILTK